MSLQYELFNKYAASIAELPANVPLSKQLLFVPDFFLHHENNLDMYYAPFDYVNNQAKIVLVGITPGWTQMEIAYRVACAGLRANLPIPEILRQAKTEASFAGTMRANLVTMLDGIGLAVALGIPSTSLLFREHSNLVHTTSSIRYPVFTKGENYTGHTPPPMKSILLSRYIYNHLAHELQAISEGFIIPLGSCVSDVLQLLVSDGTLAAQRCLIGFPHPSGGNGHRSAQYNQRRAELAKKVQTWFSDNH